MIIIDRESMMSGEGFPKGYLPIYAVDTRLEADTLMADALDAGVVFKALDTTTGREGYWATLLDEEQTMEGLFAFGRQLEAVKKNGETDADEHDAD